MDTRTFLVPEDETGETPRNPLAKNRFQTDSNTGEEKRTGCLSHKTLQNAVDFKRSKQQRVQKAWKPLTFTVRFTQTPSGVQQICSFGTLRSRQNKHEKPPKGSS